MNKTEALEFIASQNFDGADDRAIAIMATMLVHKAKEALAQPEQEPVAEAYALADKVRTELDKQSCPGVYMNTAWEAVVKNYRDLIYATPPKREWVGLTEGDLARAYARTWASPHEPLHEIIESILKEKNHD